MSVFISSDWFYSQPRVFIHHRSGSHLLPFALSVKSLIPSIHLSEQTPPHHHLPCSALCSVFKPITEGTHSDNYSVDAALQHTRVGRDVRWMAIWKQRREEAVQKLKWENGGLSEGETDKRKKGECEMKEEERWERKSEGNSRGSSAERHSATGNTGTYSGTLQGILTLQVGITGMGGGIKMCHFWLWKSNNDLEHISKSPVNYC